MHSFGWDIARIHRFGPARGGVGDERTVVIDLNDVMVRKDDAVIDGHSRVSCRCCDAGIVVGPLGRHISRVTDGEALRPFVDMVTAAAAHADYDHSQEYDQKHAALVPAMIRS